MPPKRPRSLPRMSRCGPEVLRALTCALGPLDGAAVERALKCLSTGSAVEPAVLKRLHLYFDLAPFYRDLTTRADQQAKESVMSTSRDQDRPAPPPLTFANQVQGGVFIFGDQRGIVSTGAGASIVQAVANADEQRLERLLSSWRDLLPTATERSRLLAWAGGEARPRLTVAFTDIVDSTSQCNQLGEEVWNLVRKQHFERTETVCAAHQGFCIKNTGDGVLAVFREARSALNFGLALLANPGHALVRVRVGLHVGPVILDNDDVFGSHVNLAARVMAEAKGGGLILSADVHQEAVDPRDPATGGVAWTERTEVTLKGFDGRTFTLWHTERSVAALAAPHR